MSRKSESLLRWAIHNESGQTLVWSTLLLALLLGVGGLVVDIGRAYICYHELQASTDAAALAAAAQLPITTSNLSTNTVISTGKQFGAASGKNNAYPSLNTPLATIGVVTNVVPGCVTETNLPQCISPLLANAVQVTQTVTIPTMFIRALGILGIKSAKSLTLSATTTVQMRGAQRGPYDVAFVMDTTKSMADSDNGSNCNGTKVQCAEQGAQILLSEFSPCLPGTTTCAGGTNGVVTNSVDEVSLFTFPAQTANSQLGNDEAYDTAAATCTGSHPNPDCPSVIPYPDTTSSTYSTLLSEYQVVPLSSNYRTSDAAATGKNPLTPNTTGGTTSSPSLVNAIGGNSYFGGTAQTGMIALGGVQTYYAGALSTAQQYLVASGRKNATNVIIILGDGDANNATFASPGSLNSTGSLKGTYPSATDECLQAITIAKNAQAAGTKIYVVGYGVAAGGCSTDSGVTYNGSAITACAALRYMASSDQNFFVDTSSTKCPGATTVTMNGGTNTLSAIFTAIAGDLTLPKLLPNTTVFTAMPQ
jgi:Flp pilus assembly protein TadG